MHKEIHYTASSPSSFEFCILTNPYKKYIHIINGGICRCTGYSNCKYCNTNQAKPRWQIATILLDNKDIVYFEFGREIFKSIQYKILDSISKNQVINSVQDISKLKIKLGPINKVEIVGVNKNEAKIEYNISEHELKIFNDHLNKLTTGVSPMEEIQKPKEQIEVKSGGFCKICDQYDRYSPQDNDGKVICWRCFGKI